MAELARQTHDKVKKGEAYLDKEIHAATSILIPNLLHLLSTLEIGHFCISPATEP